jgi:hypothetical protein
MPPQKYLITKDENGNYVIASPVKSKTNPNHYTLKKIRTLTSLVDPYKNCNNPSVNPVKNRNVKQTKKGLSILSYILIAIVLACLFFTIHSFCKKERYLDSYVKKDLDNIFNSNNLESNNLESESLWDQYPLLHGRS